MRIDPFRMERLQSLYEKEVDYNLSESGVSPLRVEELLSGAPGRAEFLREKLGYPWGNGSPELREAIASFYGAEADQVTVTNGGSEANHIVFWGLLEKGDRAAVMVPNYLQTWGLGRHYGAGSDTFRLVEDGGRWALDVDSLNKAVTKRTKLILVTNPNNPTGAVLTAEEMKQVVRAARRVGAWLVVDEIYRGAELAGGISPTFWGTYPKTLITSGLSKAFGLPGLRIGWVVGPPKTVAKLWSYRDYTTLTLSALSDRLASIAMQPKRREEILARTRRIVRTQLPVFDSWARSQADVLSYIAPQAGAIAYVHYRLPIGAAKLFGRLRVEESVLVTTADLHGMPGKYMRIGYGYDPDEMLKGLDRVAGLFRRIRKGQ